MLLLLVACFVTGAADGAEPAKPNIIVVMADDFGFECVTANGGQSYRTPHLDRLAAAGVRFDRCYVQPLCTPTRLQLMTGLYNVRNYVNFGTLPRGETTFAHVLKKAGYKTGICGKWQLGHEKDSPQHFGFDEAYLWQHTRRPPRYANPGLERDGVAEDYRNGEYGPDLVNDFALDFVQRHRDESFFLYYPMILTHDPFQPTPDSADYDPKAVGENVNRHVRHFAEMTEYMDKLIGKLVAKLDELKIRDNTLIVFLGDNGTSPSVTSQFRGGAYRGGKGQTTARGMHVPLIVNYPNGAAAGTVCDDLIASVDILPTICAAAGIPLSAEMKTDGISFWPQVCGKPGTPRDAYYCWYARDGGPQAAEFAMSKTHKLYADGRFFDLTADPFEERPRQASTLKEAEAEAARRLQAVLDQYDDARPAALRTGAKPAQSMKPKAEKKPRRPTAAAPPQTSSFETFSPQSGRRPLAGPTFDGYRTAAIPSAAHQGYYVFTPIAM